ncbi:hypothetical protein B0H14DRAFT_2459077, partial [Mycena olivaceomarginata]
MLLFDNADDTSINLFPFFPRCTHGNIIITSRNPQVAVHGSTSKVGNMEETDAIDLLLRSAAVEDNTVETTERASEIVKELCYLPLAIIQAGAYISKSNCLNQYLSLYKQDHARLLKEHPGQSHDDYGWTVYTTWEISFKQLSKVATQFLQMCSLLHHDKIPEAIFEKAAGWMIGNTEDTQNLEQAREFLQSFLTSSVIWNQQSFMVIIEEIVGYSLVDRHNGAVLSIHPLVQSWCQDTL